MQSCNTLPPFHSMPSLFVLECSTLWRTTYHRSSLDIVTGFIEQYIRTIARTKQHYINVHLYVFTSCCKCSMSLQLLRTVRQMSNVMVNLLLLSHNFMKSNFCHFYLQTTDTRWWGLHHMQLVINRGFNTFTYV